MIQLLKTFNSLENERTDFIFPITVFITLSEPLRTSQEDLKCFHLYNTYLLPSSRLAPLQVCSLESSAGLLLSKQKLDFLSLQAPKTLRNSFVAPLHLAWIEKRHTQKKPFPILLQGLQ